MAIASKDTSKGTVMSVVDEIKRSKCMIMASSLALVGCPIILSCVHWYPHAINYPHYRICLGTRAIIYPHYPICLGTHAIIYPHYHMYLGTRAIIYPHYHMPTILYAWVVLPSFMAVKLGYVKHSGRGSLIITFHQRSMYK